MALTKWLPRTMTGLVTVGCLLACVPLVMALLWAGGELNQFKVRTERIASEGLKVSQLGGQLQDLLKSTERSLRQFAIVQDRGLLPVVNGYLSDASQTLLLLESLDTRHDLAAGLSSSRRSLQLLMDAWQSSLSDNQIQLVITAAEAMRAATQALVDLGRQHTIDDLKTLRADAETAQRAIAISIGALLPLTALLAYGFSVAITRPLRKMNRGLADLGYGRYKRPIVITYPREMQLLGRRLDWLRERLSELELNKDRFLRHVSHELKTPLASLEEGCALLLEGRLGLLSRQQDEVARIVSEATQELGKLIDNLLTYAEWRQGEQQVERTWFDAARLIEEVCEAYQLSMQRKELRFVKQIEVAQCFGQRARLKTAVDNLVSNAIKYAPSQTGIEISLRNVDGHYQLAVRDHGPGVPETERNHIFEPFFRGTESQESNIRGTGVGLSIVMETVKAHGGTVDVENAQPGARFLMIWPGTPHESV